MFDYPAILKRDADRRILVEFPDFPEAHTYGDDEDDALMRARDALATIVDAYIRDRQPIPEPSRSLGTHWVRLPALMKAKVDLYNTMRATHVTKSDLARRLGWHLPQVDRLLNVHHASRLDQIETAFTVLGRELFIAALDRQTAHRQRIGVGHSRTAGGRGKPPARQAARRRTEARAGKHRRRLQRSKR